MRYGLVSVVAVLAMTGCVITIDKGAATGDTGDTESTPITTTETGDTVSSGDSGGHTGLGDPDVDSDGSPASLDCNDADPAIFPGAVEACDTIDNNCDGNVDDEYAASLDLTSYATLDEAVLAAVDGSRIDVCPGNHTMTPLVWSAGELRFRGVAGKDATFVSASPAGVLFTVTDSALVGVRGLILEGVPGRDTDTRTIVLTENAGLEVIESSLVNSGGGAIWLDNTSGAVVTITDSNLEGNGIFYDPLAYVPDAYPQEGGGIFAVGAFDMTITNTVIQSNGARAGGGIHATTFFGTGTLTLDNVQLDGNDGEVYGGGLQVGNVTVVGTNGSSITNNRSRYGGGLNVLRSNVDGLLISGNTGVLGGGVAVENDSLFDPLPETTLSNIVIDGNTGDDGGGIWAEDDLTLEATVSVTLNSATNTGGGLFLLDDSLTVTSNGADFGSAATYDDNTPDDVFAGAVVYPYDGAATFTCDGLTGCL
jgi:hypothetical protein